MSLYAVKADGMIIGRTFSHSMATANSHYENELQVHRYIHIELVELEVTKTLRTTKNEEAAELEIKPDKFKK
jgi:hypothetical protein